MRFHVHYGWVITAASFVIGITAYGVYYAFTLFYPFLVEDFGWSRTAISGALSLGLVAYGTLALPIGWCVDRLGPRITIAMGGLLFGLGTFLGSRITELWHVYALYGGLTAMGMSTAWAPLVSTISRWFVTHRGLAIGIGSLGGGTGVFFMGPLVSYLIVHHGWRQAYAITGILSAVLIIGAAMLMWRDPQSKNQGLPYGAEHADPQETVPPAPPATDMSLSQAMRTQVFWLYLLMFGIWWFGGAVVYVQLAPFILEKGFDFGWASWAVIGFGAGNGVGKVLMGLLTDRLGGRLTYRIATLLAAASMAALALGQAPGHLVVFSLVVGIGFGGGTPQLTTIAVDLFGLRSIGALMGTVMACMGLIGSGGPVFSGLIFDLTGSYVPAFLLGAALCGLSISLSFTLRPPGPPSPSSVPQPLMGDAAGS